MMRLPIIVLFICSMALLGYGQDSIKKAKPAAKPYSKYSTYKYHTVKAATKPGLPQTTVPTPASAVPAVPVIVDKSLKGQYQSLLGKLYHYQQPPVEELWRNVSDTLKVSKRNLKDALNKASAQNKTIDSLKTEVSTKDQSLNASNAKIDSVSLLGLQTKKSTYNVIMWGLVFLFGITAAVVILRSGIHSREAKYRTNLYTELEEEFKVYKAKANDKEKKLARELQTERNKLDELLGR